MSLIQMDLFGKMLVGTLAGWGFLYSIDVQRVGFRGAFLPPPLSARWALVQRHPCVPHGRVCTPASTWETAAALAAACWLKEGMLRGGCVAPRAQWLLSAADEMLVCVCVYVCVHISIYGLQKVVSGNTVLLGKGRIFMTVWFSGELCTYFTALISSTSDHKNQSSIKRKISTLGSSSFVFQENFHKILKYPMVIRMKRRGFGTW